MGCAFLTYIRDLSTRASKWLGDAMLISTLFNDGMALRFFRHQTHDGFDPYKSENRAGKKLSVIVTG